MARLALIMLSTLLLFGSSTALLSEALIASIVILNTLLGSGFLDFAVAAAIGQAYTLAGHASSIPAEMLINWPALSGQGVTDTPQPDLFNSLKGVNVEDYTEAVEHHNKIRRDVTETAPSNSDSPSNEKPAANLLQLKPPVDGSMQFHEKSFTELEDEIFENFNTIAHDMGNEINMHLGLRPHTIESILHGEEDAPSFPHVLETVAKRFHAPKILLAGLHSLISRTDYYEDYYELDDADKGEKGEKGQ